MKSYTEEAIQISILKNIVIIKHIIRSSIKNNDVYSFYFFKSLLLYTKNDGLL